MPLTRQAYERYQHIQDDLVDLLYQIPEINGRMTALNNLLALTMSRHAKSHADLIKGIHAGNNHLAETAWASYNDTFEREDTAFNMKAELAASFTPDIELQDTH